MSRIGRFPVIWAVPVVAAVLAGYLVYDKVREFGPQITIRFEDVSGVKPGQTPIQYRGVPVGEVTAVELGANGKYAVVKARLRRSAVSISREGTRFWIVRPKVGLSDITGLGTVITGPRIELSPGGGKPGRDFVGLENPPVPSEREGLKILLLSPRRGSLKIGSPVFYRGIEVGAVEELRLAPDATTVNIRAVIRKPYVGLVREGSMFWNASGVDVSIGLLHGVEIGMESLRSLVAGGVAFATPEGAPGRGMKDGAVFRLYDKPKPEWLDWHPQIAIGQGG
jgi:paraquat-inducible protein B